MHTILFPEGLSMFGDERREKEIFEAAGNINVIRLDAAPESPLSNIPQEHCEHAVGLMIWRLRVEAEDFERFPNLRVLVRMGVGYDAVDRKAAAARGVTVCNVPDYGTADVALYAVTAALTLRRSLLLYHEDQRTNPDPAWETTTNPLLQRISDQTFGIIGLGRIGTAAANFAAGVGFKVIYYDPFRDENLPLPAHAQKVDTLQQLLARADVLSLHVPLTEETRRIIGANELAMLPDNAVVINSARGGVLDLDALTAELKSRRLAGAGLDVLAGGDPPNPLPELLRAYRAGEAWTKGRVIITPHIAGRTPASDTDLREKAAKVIVAALNGQAYNVIAPESS